MCIRDRHYPEAEREAVWEQVQLRYAELLSKWRTDLGGKKNFHNGVGGTYDCIAIMCYYDVCRDVTTFREIEEMEEKLILSTFRKLKFVDCNKPFWRKLMYKAFVRAKSGCDKWQDVYKRQGKGCVFSFIPVAVLQGAMTALAVVLSGFMTDAVLNNLSLVGNILIFCVGINLVWPRTIKVANLLPSLLVAVALTGIL